MPAKKIGDRVFYECYNGAIESDIIQEIREGFDDIYGNGKKYIYKMYIFRGNTCIESYNCLPKSDPRVKEYIKENKKAFNFETAFLNWMKKEKYYLSNPLIKSVLSKYIE